MFVAVLALAARRLGSWAVIILVAPGAFASLRAAPAPITLLSNSLLDTKGLLGGSAAQYSRNMNGQAFQNDIILSHNGWQYTAWYDTVGTAQNMLLARRAILGADSGPWQILDTGSDLTNGDEPVWDAHNTISLGIDPRDGTLHVSWDHHVNTLRYRRSIPGLTTYNDTAWDTAFLNPEQNWLLSASAAVTGVTYPMFFNAPDGALFFNFRSGNSTGGNNHIYPWSPASAAYASSHLITIPSGSYTGVANSNASPGTFTSTSRNAYANGWDFDDNGVLHYTWTWRERTDVSNHDICYAYSPDRGVKWYNNTGTLIADNSRTSGSSIPASITVTSPGIVAVPINGRQSMINQQAQTVDAQGRVHVVCSHRRDDPGFEWKLGDSAFSAPGRAYYHYFRDPVTRVWSRRQLPLAELPGSRPDIEATANGDLYAVYQTSGRLVVAGATAAAGYADWTILATDDGDYLSEPRLDHARLRRSGVLSVLIQGNGPLLTEPSPVPIRVIDYALGPVFEALAGQDRRLIDYDRDGFVTVVVDGRVGTSSGLTATTHRWLSGTTVLATTAASTLTLAAGTHTLIYEASTAGAGHVATDTLVVEILSALPITATASANDGNVPANTLDGNLVTRWSAQGLGQHITWDLGDVYLVTSLALAFHSGDQRVTSFDLQSSVDGVIFAPLLTGQQSSGATLQPETFDFPDLNTRYLRYVGQGNSVNTWNSLTEMIVVRDAPDFDSDNDGLDDDWEQLYFGSLAATATADADGDGYNNLAEFEADSSPLNAASTPLDSDADGLPDAWETLHFGDLAQPPGGDPDGDGYNNLTELQAGTSPASAASTPLDTDADGLPNEWEQLYFGSLAQTGAADPDGDGYSNLAEFQAGTSPLNVVSTPLDTDADGLPDAWERHHFDGSLTQTPTADLDGDGFDNLDEYLAASRPADFASHPLDTDGDRLPDALSPIRPYAVDDRTLHLWHFDEFAPPFVDAANPAHALLGLLNGAAAWVSGPAGFGASVNFDTGTGTERGIVTYAEALASATTPETPTTFAWHGSDGAFTLEALVKLDSLPTGPVQIISFDGDGDGSQDRVFQFRLTTTDGTIALGFVPIATGVTGTYSVPLPVSGAHALDTVSWFHAAVTYDGRADVAGNLKLYWTRLGSGATQAILLGGEGRLSADFNQANDQGDFSIGNEARATGGSSGFFPGRIDEVRISSIARGSDGFLFNPHDTDSDGLPDAWEQARFGRLDAAFDGSDHDGDATSDRLEWLLDLDPLSGSSAWRVDVAPSPAPGGGLTVNWPARAGLRFGVERATDLATADWTTQATVTALGASASWTDPAPPSPRAFYRVKLTPP
jgi:hypothetical protein